MIKIKNLRNSKPTKIYQIRVDRISCLGNPFRISKNAGYLKRADSILKYEYYLEKEIFEKQNKTIIKEMIRLHKIYKASNRLDLYCWCAPLKCHAEVIAKYLQDEKTMEAIRAINNI